MLVFNAQPTRTVISRRSTLERWHCGATGNGKDKDNKGHRKLEDPGRGLLPAAEGQGLEYRSETKLFGLGVVVVVAVVVVVVLFVAVVYQPYPPGRVRPV